MATKLTGKARDVIQDINITPLTDVFLVLLTIMMVVAPVLQRAGQDIKPPEITAGATVDKTEVTVDVTAEGQYYIDDKTIPQDILPTILQSKAIGLTEKKLVVRADRNTKTGLVMAVFRAAQDAGFEKMVVYGQAVDVTQEPSTNEAEAAGSNR